MFGVGCAAAMERLGRACASACLILLELLEILHERILMYVPLEMGEVMGTPSWALGWWHARRGMGNAFNILPVLTGCCDLGECPC